MFIDTIPNRKSPPAVLLRESYRKALGPEHTDTALSLINLAVVYQAAGADAKAEPLLERALAIREKALGPEHPDTALSPGPMAEEIEHSTFKLKNEDLAAMAPKRRCRAAGRRSFSFLEMFLCGGGYWPDLTSVAGFESRSGLIWNWLQVRPWALQSRQPP